jgi:hypothetical protein
MLGFEVWELVMMATGAFWGAWFMWRRSKKMEAEEKARAEAEQAKGKRNRR